MIRIGMIGSDNSHAERFSELCNLKDFPGGVRGARVVAIYGRDAKRTAEVAGNAEIPRIVDDPAEMLGEVDAVTVVFRHGGLHCEHALPFLKAGIPTFVDKPFATSVRDARKMVRTAREHGTPLTSFSTLRCAPATTEFVKGLRKIGPITAGLSAGPGDVKSEYGGFIFYGIHAIEIMQECFGVGVRKVRAAHHKGNLLATIEYGGEPIVSLQVLGNATHDFLVTACGKKGVAHSVLATAGCYEAGLRKILRMVRTRHEPIPHEHMIEAIAVGEAIQKSLDTGKAASLPRKLL